MLHTKNVFPKVINILFCLLLFFTPLIWTNSTNELFEFPKMIFVYICAIIITAAFFIELVWSEKAKKDFKSFAFNPKNQLVFTAAALYFLAFLLSFIFSSHYYTSFWGYYTRFNGGLASLLCYILLFFILGFQLQRKSISQKKLFYVLFASAFLVSGYGILQHFGIDKGYWVQNSQARVFSFFGQPNWLASWLVMILFPLFIFQRETEGYLKYVFLALMLLIFLAFYFTYSFSGILGLIGALIFLVLFMPQKNWKKIILFAFLLFCFFDILLFLSSGIFPMKIKEVRYDLSVPIFRQLNGGRTTKIRLLVWRGTLDYIFSNPKTFLIGSGPETFAYSFLPFRPKEMNYTQEWDFLFNKAHNELLNIWATTGTLGLIAYFYLIFIFLTAIVKSRNLLKISLGAGIIGFLITNFFGFNVVGTNLLFWTYSAMLLNSSESSSKAKTIKPQNSSAKA